MLSSVDNILHRSMSTATAAAAADVVAAVLDLICVAPVATATPALVALAKAFWPRQNL